MKAKEKNSLQNLENYLKDYLKMVLNKVMEVQKLKMGLQ